MHANQRRRPAGSFPRYRPGEGIAVRVGAHDLHNRRFGQPSRCRIAFGMGRLTILSSATVPRNSLAAMFDAFPHSFATATL
jgi:hypothetical protein